MSYEDQIKLRSESQSSGLHTSLASLPLPWTNPEATAKLTPGKALTPAHLNLCVTLEPRVACHSLAQGSCFEAPSDGTLLDLCCMQSHSSSRDCTKERSVPQRCISTTASSLHMSRGYLVLATAANHSKTACHDPPGGFFAGGPVTGLSLSCFEAD